MTKTVKESVKKARGRFIELHAEKMLLGFIEKKQRIIFSLYMSFYSTNLFFPICYQMMMQFTIVSENVRGKKITNLATH